MALVNCNECDHGISDQATHCANCGAPQSASMHTPGKSVIRIVTLLGAIGFGVPGLIGLYLSAQDNSKFYTFTTGLIPGVLCLIVFLAYAIGPSKKTPTSVPMSQKSSFTPDYDDELSGSDIQNIEKSKGGKQ